MAGRRRRQGALDQEELERLAVDSESGGARAGLPAGRPGSRRRICAGLSLYALYWTQFAINTSIYRATFLGLILAAAFLIFPLFAKGAGRMCGSSTGC